MNQSERCYGVIPLKQEDKWYTLLVQHQKGAYWAFPKGHQEPNETPEETAARECLEETGYSVTQFLDKDIYTEQYQFQRDDNTIDKTVSYFPVFVQKNHSTHSQEIITMQWVDFDTALKTISFDQSKELLYQVNQWVEKTFSNNGK